MVLITEDERQKTGAAIKSRDIRKPYPGCGSGDFAILDGYTYLAFYSRSAVGSTIMECDTDIPCIAIAYNSCGFVDQHTLGALGL